MQLGVLRDVLGELRDQAGTAAGEEGGRAFIGDVVEALPIPRGLSPRPHPSAWRKRPAQSLRRE